jgi:(p)ppGpp synthase/HD superfamily hydrolase
MKLLFENWRRFIQEDCEVEDVLPVAHHAHYGQKRRSGSPYLTHPQAVADFAQEYGYSDLISSVAMLHDTLEDYEDVEEMSTYITNECPEALSIVQELTHEKGVDYTEYVLSLGEDALIVKLLDMLHNSQDLEPGHRQYKKYHKALMAIQEHFGGKPPPLTDGHWDALMDRLGKAPDLEIQKSKK